jgi:formate hydrogenlyase subunit 3/multisubunit Na+/H+ antiporter MnhD subunit
MNLAAVGLASVGALAGLTSLGALVLPDRVRPGWVGVGGALTGAAAVLAGGAALAGQPVSVLLPWLLPLSGVAFALDPLGGFFVAVTGAVAVAASIYGISYTRSPELRRRANQAVFPLFLAALVLVPAAAGVATLLLCWELMALTSLLLVLAEHRHRPAVAAAGRWYAVLTHLGFLAILAGLLVLAAHAPNDSFAALRAAARGLSPSVAGLVFLLTLVGFGSKAGTLPLHAWLPRAHPEAPSQVSALMSAAMVNLGVYGIVRVGFDLLGGGARWWWLLLLGLGAASAVHGILQAAMSTDLKRLLGNSTTENMGLVLIGVGAAGLFADSGNRVLAGLALAAALLHVANHAAFKTLLFLAAGSVVRATGTRDLDALGGLRTELPATTAAFGLGALAASALPPGTAFVSEWLLLQALIHGLPASGARVGVADALAMPVAVAAVALTAGLAVATFVKAFGVGFLAKRRAGIASAGGPLRESPASMLAGMAVAGAGCVVLALLPGAVLPAVGSASAVALSGLVGPGAPAVSGAITLRLAGVTGELSPLLLTFALLAGTVVAAGAARLVAARRRGWRARRVARLWDCGGGPMSARMEYTATSFTEPLQRVFDGVLRPELDVAVSHHSRYLVRAVAYRRSVPDGVERRLYAPVLAAVDTWGRAARRLAPGSVNRYLGYGFYPVCGLLIMLAVWR